MEPMFNNVQALRKLCWSFVTSDVGRLLSRVQTYIQLMGCLTSDSMFFKYRLYKSTSKTGSNNVKYRYLQ